MRPGTGIDPRPALAAFIAAATVLLALALSAPRSTAADQGGGEGPGTTSELQPLDGRGATAAQTANLFVLSGSPAPTRIHVFIAADTGRLTLTSPEGIAAPGSPPGACKQDNSTQVSCNPGVVAAIVGDLQAGADHVTADPALTVGIGIRIAGPDRPLIGAGGADLVVGGAADDLVDAGPGPDSVRGNGGTDVLRGGGGEDGINGGGSPDGIYGGGGKDKLNGGAGRDLCVGGGGRDRGRSCTVSKAIP